MEWQVGQWVKWAGKVWKVAVTQSDGVSLEYQDGTGALQWVGSYCCEQPDPFTWQVGRTYKTTLDGAFGKVLSIDDEGDIYGDVYTTSPVITSNYWHAKTGKDFNEQRGADLLPFLVERLVGIVNADEPSEQKNYTSKDGEPTTTERFTVEQRGADWFVRDNLRGRVAKFRDQTSAKTACGMMKQGDEKWIWSDELKPDPVKPQASSPYDRVIGGVEIDLWTLADIYGITSHRLFSAWKKITMAGRRGPKDKLRDLKEARVGLDKEIAKLEAEGGE